MINNLKDAQKYVEDIQKGLVKNPLSSQDSVYSLKELAKTKDKKRFKIIIDFMEDFISKAKEGGLKFFKKEPLVFIESLIMVLDHGDKANYTLIQLSRGMKIKRPPVGKTQKFFQEIYGSHFFIE